MALGKSLLVCLLFVCLYLEYILPHNTPPSNNTHKTQKRNRNGKRLCNFVFPGHPGCFEKSTHLQCFHPAMGFLQVGRDPEGWAAFIYSWLSRTIGLRRYYKGSINSRWFSSSLSDNLRGAKFSASALSSFFFFSINPPLNEFLSPPFKTVLSVFSFPSIHNKQMCLLRLRKVMGYFSNLLIWIWSYL